MEMKITMNKQPSHEPVQENASTASRLFAKRLHPGAIFVDDSTDSLRISTTFDADSDKKHSALSSQAAIPFGKTDKKTAMANAKYFSECCMSGVPSSAASDAASQAHQRHEKWWIQQCRNTRDRDSLVSDLPLPATKRRREESSGAATADANATSDEEEDDGCSIPRAVHFDVLSVTQEALKRDLEISGGDTTTPTFQRCVKILQKCYVSACTGAAQTPERDYLDGSWKALNKPTFSDCLGRNEAGEYMYTLGRIAFDVIRPTSLVCSIKGVYNLIQPLEANQRPRCIPHRLLSESGSSNMRIYE
jgi:hypothetical protein